MHIHVHKYRNSIHAHAYCYIHIYRHIYTYMYVWALVIAPLQDFYSEALPTTARTLNRSFTPKRMSNCEWRTCPGSLRGGLRWIRTRNPPAARHRTYPYTTAPHMHAYITYTRIHAHLHCHACIHTKYPADVILRPHPVSSHRPLRSSDSYDLLVPHTRTAMIF